MNRSLVQRVVIFSGLVQGVGFRFNAHQVSERFSVAGTIENLPDGTVKLVAQGTRSELEAFVHAIVHSTRGRVTHIETTESLIESSSENIDPSTTFNGFSIRR
ncbi:MAG: acylphosphatase [Planctomycetota bacterium]